MSEVSARPDGPPGTTAERRWLIAGLLALASGAVVAVAGPGWGSLLIGGALLLCFLLPAIWCRLDWGVAALAFLIPLQIRLNLAADWALAVGFIGISGLAGVLALRQLLGRTGDRRRTPDPTLGTRLLLSTFCFLPAVASLWVTPELVDTVRRLLYLSWFLLLFWILPSIIQSEEAIERVVRALVAGGVAAALVGLAQFALQFVVGPLALLGFWIQFVSPILEGERTAGVLQQGTNWVLSIGGQALMRAIGPFFAPQDAAQYLGVCLPLAAARLLSRPRLRARDLLLLAILLLFLTFTFARQAWVGVSAGLSAVALGSWLSAGRPSLAPGTSRPVPTDQRCLSRRLSCLLVGSILLALGALGVASSTRSEAETPVLNRLLSITDPSDGSNQDRFFVWSQALTLAERHPMLGVGLGGFAIAAQGPRGYYAHNAYLDFLVETGPVGLLGLLGLLGWGLSTAWHIARHGPTTGLQLFGLGSLGSVTAVAVIFFFDDAFYIPRAGQALWLLLGLLAAAAQCCALGPSRHQRAAGSASRANSSSGSKIR
jgi:O-antigen ligase